MSSLEELQAEKKNILEELKASILTLSDLQNERQESIGCLKSLIQSIEGLVSADRKVAEAIKDVIDKELKETIFGVEKLRNDVSNLQVAFDGAFQTSFEPLLGNLKKITVDNSSELERFFAEATNRIHSVLSEISASVESAQDAIQRKYSEFDSFVSQKSTGLANRLSMVEDNLEPLVTKSLSVVEKLSETVVSICDSTTKLQQSDSQFRTEMSVLVKEIVREELKSQLETIVMNTRQLSEDINALKNKKSGLFGGILK